MIIDILIVAAFGGLFLSNIFDINFLKNRVSNLENELLKLQQERLEMNLFLHEFVKNSEEQENGRK